MSRLYILIESYPGCHEVINPTLPAPVLGRVSLNRVFLRRRGGAKTLEIHLLPAPRKVGRQ